MKEITEFEKEQCSKCRYRARVDLNIVCNYLEITGMQRPTPVGEPCQEYVEGEQLILRNKALRIKGFKAGEENPNSKKPARRKPRKKYSELTEEEKEIRREATRRYRKRAKE